jgi:hypothetical protein
VSPSVDARRSGRGAVALLIVTMVMLTAEAGGVSAATQSIPPVSFDSTLFLATVPSYAVIGHNYTVIVLVTNNLNVSNLVLVRVDAPVDAAYSWPLLQTQTLQPFQQAFFNFTLIPFGSNSGRPINVTALLWIWNVNSTRAPQLVQSASKLISGVTPSSQVVAAAVVIIVAGLGVTSFLVVRRLRRGHGPPSQTEAASGA